MPDTGNLLAALSALAHTAGIEVMKIYAEPVSAALKADLSPVTEADLAAERIILEGLARLAPEIPVISEEAASQGRIPAAANRFFLVDPLDGTREFISRNGEFTINIALIENAKPVAGVVYAPAINRIFRGAVGLKAEQATLSTDSAESAGLANEAEPPTAAAPESDLPPWHHHSLVDPQQLPPMLRHYVELKAAHPERLLLYRLGDFFECFFEDAITISQLLELTLTGKEAGKAHGRVPMAGIPHHAAERYCGDLVRRDGGWTTRRFAGTRWQAERSEAQFVLNTYRVLLTRARAETVIWVPRGSGADDPFHDATRDSAEFDAVADHLLACGARPLEATAAPPARAEPVTLL
jgi:hypothetical protein